MVSSAASILLTEKANLRPDGPVLRTGTARSGAAVSTREPFLRIPPFPGGRLRHFARGEGARVEPDALLGVLKRLRVGGTYWAAQPGLPGHHVLVTSAEAVETARRIFPSQPIVLWRNVVEASGYGADVSLVRGACDPWHMLGEAIGLIADADDDLCLIADLLEVPRFNVRGETREPTVDRLDEDGFISEMAGSSYKDPFTGVELTAVEAAELCGFWRRLIDSNRDIGGAAGFAFWKQSHVAPLLWGGSNPLLFMRGSDAVKTDAPIALWRVKASSAAIQEMERSGRQLIEVEDGFLRSRGLGANCVPPLSITVDRLGAHFDPAQASELEHLLQVAEFDESLIRRAKRLRALIVEAGIGKYGCGSRPVDRRAGERRHILVPGQVEDDRAVVTGGCGLSSNLELLQRVRDAAPDAYILYKPHPDVLAGHRRGAIDSASCLCYADEIVGEVPIAPLIAMADEVHVNTSLAGFEALMREKTVVTYGVPFYAGWGLTTDMGPVPSRRTTRRSLDELVAATLLLYPRYLDPVTGLPCPAEVVVDRLSAGGEPDASLVVGMRRLQGKLMRRLRSIIQ